MRIHFELDAFEPFHLDIDGARYPFNELQPLAQKARVATNVHEYVYKLPTGKYVYVTMVGDEDQTSGFGVGRGWYVAEILSEKDAHWLIEALKPFTQLYK